MPGPNPKKALLIDDHENFTRSIADVLELKGYEVETASDGKSGLEKAARTPPDLVVVDLMMPKMHGFEVVERLRKNPATADAVIIVASAKSFPSDVELALNAGADGYLTKPFGLDDLAAKIAEIEEKKKG